MSRFQFLAIGMIGFLGLAQLEAADPSFQSFSDLSGVSGANVTDVSGDGSVLVGTRTTASGPEGFRWSEDDGFIDLGDLPGGNFSSSARAVSENGMVVVGSSEAASGTRAFRWTVAEGMVELHDLPGGSTFSSASDVSKSGTVIVGYVRSPSFQGTQAFRWTASSGMAGLGDLPPAPNFSIGLGVSANGGVVVGYGTYGVASGNNAGFRWTSSGGMVRLNTFRRATAVSANGSVVVGYNASFNTTSSAGSEAFLWSSSTGSVALGALSPPGGDFYSQATDVSGDGAVVVGNTLENTEPTAFLWTAPDGMRALKEILTNDFCLDLTGWKLLQVRDISADGTTVIGFGTNPDGQNEIWVATLGPGRDCNANGMPDGCEYAGSDCGLPNVNGEPLCAATDVNCDGVTNVGDLAAIQAPLNWALGSFGASNGRTDVNRDCSVNALDLASVQAPTNWATSTGPCHCCRP